MTDREIIESLISLVLEMGSVIRQIDEDNEHYEYWNNDRGYIPDTRFKNAVERLISRD